MSTRRPVRNNYILIVFDSCRYDSFVRARPQVIKKLGPVERRWSYASWTSPSHFNLLIGLLPHKSPRHVYASEYYKTEFLKFNERLGVDDLKFASLVPRLYLPLFLKESLGYRTHARVSLPVLNPKTILNQGFDSYKLMENHNDMRAMLREMPFSEEHPSFYLLNIGETHYPYALPDEPPEEWPRISGVHGVFKHLDDHVVGGKLVKRKESFSITISLKNYARDRFGPSNISMEWSRNSSTLCPRIRTSRLPRTTANCSEKMAISGTDLSNTQKCGRFPLSKANSDENFQRT